MNEVTSVLLFTDGIDQDSNVEIKVRNLLT
jgi:hypothetical protein